MNRDWITLRRLAIGGMTHGIGMALLEHGEIDTSG
jgi:CO/xanthine dehydrogenase Mo-binding subunit